MAKSKWSNKNIANQKDKVIIITGASSGLGKQATKVLAYKNATVIMAVRNIIKGEQVAQEIKSTQSDAQIEVMELDLNSIASVTSFVTEFSKSFEKLDILINNAGVMACPFSKTKDGLEIQMGVNHMGHFALTGLLMPMLRKSKAGRVVATSSMAHKQGNINFDDINWANRNYSTTKAYGDSKLANLYFAYELARKCKVEGNNIKVTAAHPGWTNTDLGQHSLVFSFLSPLLGQGVENGTLPTLRAATDESANAGDYYGPSGWQEIKGFPVIVPSNKLSKDTGKAKKLWDVSEELTGIKY